MKQCERCLKHEPEVSFRGNWPKVCDACKRTHQRAYYQANRGKYLTGAATYRQREKLKRAAAQAVFLALQSGQIKRTPCWVCGSIKSEAHHGSYAPDMRLSVIWLCRSHHREAHALV